MSFIVAGIAAGLAAAAGAWLGARALRSGRSAQVVDAREPEAGPKLLAGIDMQLGDVVLFGQEEAWLKAALLLEESRTCVAAVFFTHHGPQGDVVFVQPAPQRLLLRMKPALIDFPSGHLPSVVEHLSHPYRRVSRRPVTLRRIGEELPPTDPSAILCWFEASDGMLLIALVGASSSLSWTADPAADASAVRLAAGQATFRDL